MSQVILERERGVSIIVSNEMEFKAKRSDI